MLINNHKITQETIPIKIPQKLSRPIRDFFLPTFNIKEKKTIQDGLIATALYLQFCNLKKKSSHPQGGQLSLEWCCFRLTHPPAGWVAYVRLVLF
jgi:hypothetical protein